VATVLKHLLLERRRDWLTMPELAEHGKFMCRDGKHFSPTAAARFVRREYPRGLPAMKRGRVWLVEREAFDRYILAQGIQRSA